MNSYFVNGMYLRNIKNINITIIFYNIYKVVYNHKSDFFCIFLCFSVRQTDSLTSESFYDLKLQSRGKQMIYALHHCIKLILGKGSKSNTGPRHCTQIF